MRTLRIRKFILLCFFLVMLLPWIFFVTAHFMETQSLRFSNSRQDESLQRQLTETIRMIEAGSNDWTDPNWQNRLLEALRETKMDAVIYSASDQEIFRSNSERRRISSSAERFSVMEDGRLLGRVVLYSPKAYTVQTASAVAGLLLAFFVVGIEMRRFVIKPLERMSAVTRQIATGDWNVTLPKSRITEIAEVRDGFERMVNGLRQSYRKQAKSEEERRFVIAAVAHDLRTPLFALRGYLDGLEQGIAQSPEKMAKYVAVCKEKSAQLDRLVEDLFTFTKMEYLETELNKTAVDLRVILQKSMDSVSPAARQRQISITNHADDGAFVSGDAHALERAMSNLLDNAVRHTPSGGEIMVHGRLEGNKVTFSIRDTGPGFSPEELERIFEPLYRGEASRNRSTGGSGLGLTISRRIIFRHGGELTATNHPDGGALISGWIPANGSIDTCSSRL